ncbi:MAG TPA: winged helix DNA-binding domain-containing protein [Solirubrobacteraceae bacterium]|nr:winged helix DNA-binding domain-containing protein [Solirubrobacteraceae bacterium]
MAAGTAPVLTQRQLNRALLARQLLLERTPLRLPTALERMGGLQAQYAPSMYIGLWSRVEGFERDALTRALERRTVVQGTLMRSTIHLVSARDYWPLSAAVRSGRQEWWLRTRREGPSAREIAAGARRLRRRLADGPLRAAEIDQLLGKPVARAVGLWLELVRVPPSGTWERRRADLYAAAEEWLGPAEVTPKEGLDHLVRRYLGGFGPSSAREIAGFAGVPPTDIDPALDRLRLRRFRGEDGEELFDLPRAPLPDPETPAPPRFLPVWDATLLVHARRTGILPEEHRARVFNPRTPHSVNTFLVDGAVAGTWRYERGRVPIEPFGRLDRAVRRQLDDEAERLAALHR